MSANTLRNTLLGHLEELWSQKMSFESYVLELFKYQVQSNDTYREYLKNINRYEERLTSINAIPHLPIQFFKSREVKSMDFDPECVFMSSGTTSMHRSKNYVRSLDIYLKNAVKCFEEMYGSTKDYCFVALLPGYNTDGSSSLIRMVDHFIGISRYDDSCFMIDQEPELKLLIEDLRKRSIPTVLIGVSFAFYRLSQTAVDLDLSDVILMETGGMKNQYLELSKPELHALFKDRFNVQTVHSEYGMTELLSQSYSKADGRFQPSRSMHVSISELNDPFAKERTGKTGRINIIDAANVDSCAFISTDDLGRKFDDGSFEVLGRIDNTDLRGCNLLLSDV